MRGLRRGGAPPGRDGRHGAASTARRNQRHAGGFDKDGRRHRRARSSHCPRRSRYLDSDGGWYKSREDRTDGPGCYYYRGADGEGGRGQGGEAKSDESRSLGAGSGRGAWQVQILIVGTCMLLCNLDRVAMGILAVPLIQEFSLSMTQLGVLQSSYLWGYLIGQLPAGLASDRYGGVPVMLVGLLVWSLATCGTALAKFSANPLSIAIASRVLMGLGSSVALPAVAATVASNVPSDQKARATTLSYALFNIGNVVVSLLSSPLFFFVPPPTPSDLLTRAFCSSITHAQQANLCTPYVSEYLGWHWSFAIYGSLGVLWAALSWYLYKKSRFSIAASKVTRNLEARDKGDRPKPSVFQLLLKRKVMLQVLILAYCHSTIGLGYFTLQSWIPVFMAKDLGIASLKVAGLCTAVVWLATSFNTAFVGVIADKLLSKMEFWKVRKVAMTVSTIIPAGCFFVLSTTQNPMVGIFCILIGLVSWSFDYAGFHPYIVEVSGEYSGTILSFTNSAGVIAGIAGNIATGYLVGLEGNFTSVFRILSGVYLVSCILWNIFMKGEKLEGM